MNTLLIKKCLIGFGGITVLGGTYMVASSLSRGSESSVISEKTMELSKGGNPFEMMEKQGKAFSSLLPNENSDDTENLNMGSMEVEEIKGVESLLVESESQSLTQVSEAAKEESDKKDDCDPLDAASGLCENSNEIENSDVVHSVGDDEKPYVSAEDFQNIIAGHESLPAVRPPTRELYKSTNYQTAEIKKNSGVSPSSDDVESALIQSDDPWDMLSAGGGGQSLYGRKTTVTKGTIREGCRVLAMVEDTFRLSQGQESITSLVPIAELQDCGQLPKFKMKGLAKVEPGGRIAVSVSSCRDIGSLSKSYKCKGVVKDFMGVNGLPANVYSTKGWQLLAGSVSNFLSGLTLSSIEQQAVSGDGVIQSMNYGNKVKEALAGAITETGNLIQDTLKAGDVSTVERRAIVQVLFIEDAEMR